MLTIINTLVPIFFLILLGYFFKFIKFPHEDFWKHLDKFNYFVLFPSLLVYKLSTANINEIKNFDFILVAIISLLIISTILIIYNKIKPYNDDAFTSIYQGAIRFNTYVFLALVDTLFNDSGLIIAAILITFLIPVINILCITIFCLYIPNSKVTFVSFSKSIIKNPLILACILGGSLNYFSFHLPLVLETTLSILSMAALPLGLLSVGVGLHLSSINETKSELIVSSISKLILVPIVMFIVGNIFELEYIYVSILILFAAMPTAPSAYVLARELGGDMKLISSIISIQTIISIVTISVFIQFIKI